MHRFEKNLKHLFGKPNICLEIGVHYGASSVWILERLCNTEGSYLYGMDVTQLKGYTLLEDNLAPYKNFTYIEGFSVDSFKTFNHNGQTKEFLDFVYIDGEHETKYVLEDAINSFHCLKSGGIMAFDDYGNYDNNDKNFNYNWTFNVRKAVDTFELCYKNKIEVIEDSYQKWFIKK